MTWFLGKDLNPKKVGERGQAETTCGFSKNVFSRERVKLWVLLLFNIIISYFFPGHIIKILFCSEDIDILILNINYSCHCFEFFYIFSLQKN